MKLPQPDVKALTDRLAATIVKQHNAKLKNELDELTIRVPVAKLISVMQTLHTETGLVFDTLIDLCGVDNSELGKGYEGLFTQDAISRSSFAETKEQSQSAEFRFAVVYHLLSTKYNHRVRVKVLLSGTTLPLCPSVIDIWPVANWYEREAFDLFGIAFEGHPDLRRILTDYGFVGHPFRRDFPVHGKVEMRYDPAQGRVVYQPVSIEPREVVPRIRRKDNFGKLGKLDG